jgi:hypothetical protein
MFFSINKKQFNKKAKVMASLWNGAPATQNHRRKNPRIVARASSRKGVYISKSILPNCRNLPVPLSGAEAVLFLASSSDGDLARLNEEHKLGRHPSDMHLLSAAMVQNGCCRASQ